MVSGGGTISKIWVVMTKNETETINTFRNTKEAACVLVIVGVFFTSREEAMLVMVGVEQGGRSCAGAQVAPAQKCGLGRKF